jgi:hypothetical protein
MRATVKIIHYCLSALLLFAVAGCDRLEQDMLSAPDDTSIDRYGLDTVKLGDKRPAAGEQLQALLDQPMQCKPGKTGLGDKRKAYVMEECNALPIDGSVGKLWDEKLSFLKAVYVEDQLCSLELQLKTSGDYEALYNAHGKKIINLLGKPDEVTAKGIRWQRETDEAILKDLGDGKVRLEFRNKQVMQALHHQG